MAYGCPSDTSPIHWYDVAKNIDQNWADNEAFRLAYKVPAPIPTCHFTTSIIKPPPPVIHANPTQNNPVPMDINMGWRRNTGLQICYRCNKPGHKAPDCPLRFDVRELTIEELKMELMTRMDMARAEALPLEVEEKVVQERGFVQDNEWRTCPHCLLIIISISCPIYVIQKWFYQTCKTQKQTQSWHLSRLS